jgi:hypothetical protein
MKAQAAQRAHLEGQLRALMRDLEAGRLNGARIVVERSSGKRTPLGMVRDEESEHLVRCVLRLLAACPSAAKLEDLREPVLDLALALGLREPGDAREILRAWTWDRKGRR